MVGVVGALAVLLFISAYSCRANDTPQPTTSPNNTPIIILPAPQSDNSALWIIITILGIGGTILLILALLATFWGWTVSRRNRDLTNYCSQLTGQTVDSIALEASRTRPNYSSTVPQQLSSGSKEVARR